MSFLYSYGDPILAMLARSVRCTPFTAASFRGAAACNEAVVEVHRQCGQCPGDPLYPLGSPERYAGPRGYPWPKINLWIIYG